MKGNLIALIAGLLLVGCTGNSSPARPQELSRIRLPMGYIPNIQYAPFYVAADRGHFATEGIDIEFDYSLETDGVALVGAGELPFALASGDQVILARAKGLPVVYIMQWYQRYPIAVISRAGSGIRAPGDLAGRRIGIPGLFGASYVGLEGLLGASGLSDVDVDLVEIGFTQAEALAQNRVEAAVVYANNEPIVLRSQGESLDVIKVGDYVNMVATGLVTNEDTISKDPLLVESMTRAILRGLVDVLADPDQALEISHGYLEDSDPGPQQDETQRAILAASLAMWRTARLGNMSTDAWQNTEQVLLSIGFIENSIDLEAAWTNRFVEEAGLR